MLSDRVFGRADHKNENIIGTLQLLGAGCLVVVVLTHVAEALRLFPSMRWGDPQSAGHYVDLTSAVLGVTLLLSAWLARPGHEPSR